jgi:hypothetical protein
MRDESEDWDDEPPHIRKGLGMDIVEDNKKNKLRLISKHGMHFI